MIGLVFLEAFQIVFECKFNRFLEISTKLIEMKSDLEFLDIPSRFLLISK